MSAPDVRTPGGNPANAAEQTADDSIIGDNVIIRLHAVVAPPTIREKRERTLQARCALRGVCLWPCHDDHGRPVYVATRDEITMQLRSLDEVEAWLQAPQ